MTTKTVLVTGGTGGIGRAAAVGLASMGARVAITVRDRARAERAAAGIADESGHPTVDFFVADMSSLAEVEGVTGEYFVNRKTKKSEASSYDTGIAARLWQVSADLVGIPADMAPA